MVFTTSKRINKTATWPQKFPWYTFAYSLDTKSYFHPTNSWIKVELRVTRKMEKKRCHNGRHLFLAFHPKTTRHVSPSSSLIARARRKLHSYIHAHVHTQAVGCYFDSLVATWPSCHWNRSPWSFHALFCLRFVGTSEFIRHTNRPLGLN